uniref:Probable cytosol aminopeptidase n=2 Tax=Nitratidesulfovibrio TaxID=2802295 RepID=B8DLW0_NITV9
MDIRFQVGGPAQWRADAVIVFLFEGEALADAAPELLEAAPWLGIAPAVRDFRGRKDEVAVFHGHPDLAVPRVIAAGLGKREAFAATAPAGLRAAAGAALRRCRELKIETVAVDAVALARVVETGGDAPAGTPSWSPAEEAVCGALLGLYRYDRFKTNGNGNGGAEAAEDARFEPRWLGLLCAEASVPDDLHAAARRGEAAAAGVALARDLVNGPPNFVTPGYLAEQAVAIAKKYGMQARSLGRAELVEMGMGAFASVFRGAEEEPRLVVIEHAPKGTEDQKPLVFVGKGITFDTGGISLKPPAKMHEMKGDMAGAAAVLGLFEALGRSDVPRRVVGIMPCTENMPDGRATRPGDIVTTLSGKTVEVINTDAEGRLVLCDAMTWAQREYAPEVVVDLATLTGACVVALGMEVAAVFATDDALSGRIRAVGDVVGDRFWPLPLWDMYFENLKSDVADIANVGPREGGAVNAALFLKQFVDKGVRWAHLDIAGPAYTAKKTSTCPGGGTGFAVRTLLELVRGGV